MRKYEEDISVSMMYDDLPTDVSALSFIHTRSLIRNLDKKKTYYTPKGSA